MFTKVEWKTAGVVVLLLYCIWQQDKWCQLCSNLHSSVSERFCSLCAVVVFSGVAGSTDYNIRLPKRTAFCAVLLLGWTMRQLDPALQPLLTDA
jgi:hypothetical protein